MLLPANLCWPRHYGGQIPQIKTLTVASLFGLVLVLELIVNFGLWAASLEVVFIFFP